MTSARLLAISLVWPLLVLTTLGARAELRSMNDDELSQVQAAGLPDPALRQLAAGVPVLIVPAMDTSLAPTAGMQDLHNALDRQQALSQWKLASASAQGSVGLMQAASLPALFTPFAPLFLPSLAMPFPFLMALPPKKPDPGH